MLKLPAVLWGMGFLLIGIAKANWGFIGLGTLLLIAGLYFFGWDFGQASGTGNSAKQCDESSETEDEC